jgi:hypothetical protein
MATSSPSRPPRRSPERSILCQGRFLARSGRCRSVRDLILSAIAGSTRPAEIRDREEAVADFARICCALVRLRMLTDRVHFSKCTVIERFERSSKINSQQFDSDRLAESDTSRTNESPLWSTAGAAAAAKRGLRASVSSASVNSCRPRRFPERPNARRLGIEAACCQKTPDAD